MRKYPKFIEAEDRRVFNVIGYFNGCFIIEDASVTYYDIESGHFYGLEGEAVKKLTLKAMYPEVFRETVKKYSKLK